MGTVGSRLQHSRPSSASISSETVATSKHRSLHEGLVRERDTKHDFDDIYEVLNDIGKGGLCEIYKIRKRNEKIGGSARPDLVRRRNTVSFSNLAKLGKPSPQRCTSASIANNNSDESSSLCYAMKVINLKLVASPEKANQIKNEVELLKTLDHKNIIKAYETFIRRDTKQLIIVMELCTGGDLYARMPYTEQQVASVTQQVLSAIAYMHDRSIVHRDLKMENIMFESPHPYAAIKVIDFGLSKEYSKSESVLKERVGTLYSMSPETMQGNYTEQADLWSIGVCTYIMLSGGEKPFIGKTPKQLVAKVLLGQYSFDPAVWDGVSEDAKDFIRKLLIVEPQSRLTAKQAIHHEWFGNHLQQVNEDFAVDEEFKQRVRENIVRYSEFSEFRKLALNVIAKKSSAQEIFELRRVFDEFDTEKLGTLSLDEFKAALAQFNYSDKDICALFHKVDVNGNNVINYTEFLAAALETQGTISEIQLAEAFDQLDSDDSGYISRQDLKRVLGEHADDTYVNRLLAQGDFKKDGKISYEEFLQVFSEKKYDQMYNMFESSASADNASTHSSTDDVLNRFGLLAGLRRGISASASRLRLRSDSAGLPGSASRTRKNFSSDFFSALSC